MLILKIPTINDDPGDFDRLFRLWEQVEQTDIFFEEVFLDFSHCAFLRQNAVAFIGGLARLIESRFGTVTFAWDTLQDGIRANLAQNGFLSAFGATAKSWVGNSIPYREDREQDVKGIIDYLQVRWLGRGWVYLSRPLSDAIVGTVWEVYANAFEHSQSPVGVISCGQHYPTLQMLKLTAVDFGVGIPNNVQRFHDNPQIQPASALKWAFQRGTTTNPTGSRGMGLDLLKEFVRRNHGKLEVYSHQAYAMMDEAEEVYTTRSSFFEGTLVNITLRCTESSYHSDAVGSDQPLF